MLEIALLGHFEMRLDGEPIDLTSRTLRKLIAYLALRAGRSVSRTKLAGILWPDSPEATARKNLRQYVWRLRRAIGEDFLLTDRATIALSTAGLHRLDVGVLAKEPTKGDMVSLVEAVSAYKGELLPGFYDDWIRWERERLRATFEQRMQALLEGLVTKARWSDLVRWSEHWIAFGQTPEAAYRSLMIGHAELDDMAGVARAYDRCREALRQELGVEPSAETRRLFERLSQGEPPVSDEPAISVEEKAPARDPAASGTPAGEQMLEWLRIALAGPGSGDEEPKEQASESDAVRLPPFLKKAEVEDGHVRPVFVDRQAELARLNDLLQAARHRQHAIAFLSGDAGSGKSSLMRAFSTAAGDLFPDLLVAWGTCNAFAGRGDPYLPFRQALSALTGEVQATWSAGTITGSQARRLWTWMPAATEVLLESAPDLLDSLIPTSALLARLQTAFPNGAPLLQKVQESVNQERPAVALERPQLFEQVAGMLRRLAKEHTIVLVLDDVQWADIGSLDLLFHLGRSLEGTRVLLLVAYRPDEVTSEKDHPLRPLLDEFRRTYGDAWLDLDRAPGRAFVDALVDREENALDEDFREALCRRTEGHPLFTVELLREMQERADLVRDESGAWMAETSLDWNVLPARVEGAIASRIGRLDDDLRDILQVAAVEGETFTVQVVARVQDVPERWLLKTLSRDLQQRHQLVEEQGNVEMGGRQLIRYRFSHALFQRYLYDELGAGERRFLHGDVAAILETLHGDSTEEIAVQLAHHYAGAADYDRAVPYLLQAGDSARRLYAFDEAARHYERALSILKQRGEYESAGRVLMKIGLTYHGAVNFKRSSQAYQEGFLMLRQASDRRRASELPAPPHALRITSETITDLNPMRVANLPSFRVAYQLFGRLLTLNRDIDVVPDMAESWHIVDEGRTYEFKLRDGLFWSDGQPVTAGDFACRLRRELDPGNESQITHRWSEIEGATAYRHGQGSVSDLGIEIPDPRTLRLRLEHPSGIFLQNLVHLAPIPRHVVDEVGPQWAEPGNIVSCGPYLLESWERGDSLHLKRNPYYYGDHQGNVQQVQLRFFEDSTEIIEAYEAGEVDIAELPAELYWAIPQHAANYISWPSFGVAKVNFNTHRPPFEDVRVRRAVLLATDRPFLAEVAGKGLVTPATGSYIPSGLPGHRPDVTVAYDPERADRLLARAGYPRGKGLPTVKALAYEGYAHLREPLDHFWQEHLGLTVEWAIADWQEYNRRLGSDEADLFIEGVFAPTPNPDELMSNFAIPRLYWEGDTFRSVVEEARTVADPLARLKLYKQAEDILLEEVPLFPLHYFRHHYLLKPWVSNFRPTMLFLEFWKDVILEPHE